MKKKRKLEYAIYDGLVISKLYKGKECKLIIKEENGTFRYHVNNKIFASSSSAAKYVKKNNTEVSGPYFWKLPIKNIVS